LHANDGSEHAFNALGDALAMDEQNNSDLHMVSVEEIDYMPNFIEEVREETGGPRDVFTRSFNARAAWPNNIMSHSVHMVIAGSGSGHRRPCQRAQS